MYNPNRILNIHCIHCKAIVGTGDVFYSRVLTYLHL